MGHMTSDRRYYYKFTVVDECVCMYHFDDTITATDSYIDDISYLHARFGKVRIEYIKRTDLR